MKIIFGLGNPSKKYAKTRHNSGFLFLDFLAQKIGATNFQLEAKFQAEIAASEYKNEKILLVKPQTFMNLSGQTVRLMVNFYKLTPKDWLVIYDDKDLDFGMIRFREKGSSGGHNGIKSIIASSGENFRRLKIGIAAPAMANFAKTADFVLSNFTKEEQQTFPQIFEKAFSVLKEKLENS